MRRPEVPSYHVGEIPSLSGRFTAWLGPGCEWTLSLSCTRSVADPPRRQKLMGFFFACRALPSETRPNVGWELGLTPLEVDQVGFS